ncbi:ABC transporter ATP-binding protein [Pararhodonellum marinum]|uniref:ABC transporter ATP-binding protein n=1 Tax=Pararhodonellum marinum TaxID=2755358 RepID=UPI00188F1B51|nr:ABC transporter ATP-binding protein [Pararhodonellum marinum]
MLQVDRLSFQYGNHLIFKEVSFTLKEGELCAILGINGSGKSTLFKCCMGFLQPYAGEIHLKDQPLAKLKTSEIAKNVAYVPQEHPVTFPFLVREMVLMGRTTHISNFFNISDQHHLKVEEALQSLSLDHLADKPFSQLSGGQRQMVLIARAIAQETPLMLLDEPTSSLDFKNQLLIWNMLLDLKKQGKALFVCTHDPNHVLWFCDRVLVMDNQKLIADGPPEEVLGTGILKQIYGPICEMKQLSGSKMVIPNYLGNSEGEGSSS